MKEWFIKWFQTFFDKHGERIFYLAVATLFGVCFLIVGIKFENSLKELVGAGLTILIGVAQLCFNKSRSPEKEEKTNVPNTSNDAA